MLPPPFGTAGAALQESREGHSLNSIYARRPFSATEGIYPIRFRAVEATLTIHNWLSGEKNNLHKNLHKRT
jgi:hypothetical protein